MLAQAVEYSAPLDAKVESVNQHKYTGRGQTTVDQAFATVTLPVRGAGSQSDDENSSRTKPVNASDSSDGTHSAWAMLLVGFSLVILRLHGLVGRSSDVHF